MDLKRGTSADSDVSVSKLLTIQVCVFAANRVQLVKLK